MHLGMGMVQTHRLEHRLELKQTLQDGGPPNPTRGFKGFKVADEILKRLGVVGLLTGGCAHYAWTAKTRDRLSARKDVDVLVLSDSSHPDRFEGGIDWWLSAGLDEPPENGNGAQWVWNARLSSVLEPGLYLPVAEVLLEVRKHERLQVRDRLVPLRRLDDARRCRVNPLIREYPIMGARQLVMRLL